MAPLLPDPDEAFRALQGTPFAASIEQIAEGILDHRFPLLGLEIATGETIRWSRDYVHDKEAASGYVRTIPYLDSSAVGDHKIVWELNRHQHLVLLAQAARLTGRNRYLDEIAAHLDSWLHTNPYAGTMQWASALEVAFRTLSWLWLWRLVGDKLPAPLKARLLEAIWRHAVFLEHNLSLYFSPNTHLIGEAVALHAVGRLFPDFPRAARWRQRGARVLGRQILAQVRDDGSHFEQSSYYHVYALDLFLFHALLEDVSPGYLERLGRMADYLEALLGPRGRIPLLGDDDGGRLFHPYGRHREYGRASLAAYALYSGGSGRFYEDEDLLPMAVWWMGARRSARPAVSRGRPAFQWFPDAQVAFRSQGARRIVVDCKAFGGLSSGHSHAAALALYCDQGDEDILTDPGTYSYVGDAGSRALFRGTAMHSTIRIGGRDQARAAGPFGWTERPTTEVHRADADALDATCVQGPYRHRRLIRWRNLDCVLIEDTIEGPAEAVEIEQFWHPGGSVELQRPGQYKLGSAARLRFPDDAEIEHTSGGEFGWISDAYGVKREAQPLCRRVRAVPPIRLETSLAF